MSLTVCIFVTWCIMIILTIIPKELTELEMVFLFFVCTIFALSVFTVFHLNLHWIDVNRSIEKSLADLVIRLACIPVMLVIATNIMLYPSKYLKWVIVVALILVDAMIQKLEMILGVMSTPHWNSGYSALMFGICTIFARLMAWFIISLGKKEGKTS